jgi:hypothetical protein
LAKAFATERIPSTSPPVGSGAHFWLDLPQPEDELRDYERLCASGEAFVYAAMYESSHGEAIGSHLRTFHTVSEDEFSETQRLGGHINLGNPGTQRA